MPTFYSGQRLTDFTSVDVAVERVASGGMGIVAFGPDQGHQKQWAALKTMRPDLLAHESIRDRFISEALTWVGLWPHANILLAQFLTEINGVPMLVLDYAEHGSLRDLLRAARRQGQSYLPLGAVIEVAQNIAAGLIALHTPDPVFQRDRPIVHRDLKPDNILLDEHGLVMITDFGLAKAVLASEADLGMLGFGTVSGDSHQTQMYHTQRGIALGTFPYMPPEQWLDTASVDTPADLYAFGQILAEISTGEWAIQPERGTTPQAWKQAHQQQLPRALRSLVPALPAGLDGLVQDLLAKDPARRPTAVACLERLNALAVQQGQKPYTPPEVVSHTPEQERIKWQSWANTYWRFQRYDEALVRINRALALAPTNVNCLISRGNILQGLQQWQAAQTDYEQALALTPSADSLTRNIILNQLGTMFNASQRYPQAEAMYAQAVAVRTAYADSWYNRANNERLWAQAEAGAGHISEAREHAAQGLAHARHTLALSPDDQATPRLIATLEALQRQLGG